MILGAAKIKLQNWSTSYHVNCILPKENTDIKNSNIPFESFVIQQIYLDIKGITYLLEYQSQKKQATENKKGWFPNLLVWHITWFLILHKTHTK